MIFDFISLFVLDGFWSAVAAVGFAILFNVPPRLLWGCALTGAVGHASRTLLMETMNPPLEAATLAAAVLVGFLGVALARRLRAPSLIFTVSGAIPMVPGLLAYGAMLALLQLTVGGATDPAVLQTAIADAFRVVLILGAIALGITMPKLIFRRVKPVV